MKKLLLLVTFLTTTNIFAQKLKWTVYDQKKKKIYSEIGTCPADYPKNDEFGSSYCFKNYDVRELDFSIEIDNVFQVVQSKTTDTLWFASAEDGLVSFFDFKWKNFTTTNSELPYDRVNRIFQKDGFGVMAMTSNGIHYFGPKNEINSHFPQLMEGVSGTSIVDRNNTVWNGYTGGGGLWKTNGTDYIQWTNLTQDNSNAPFVDSQTDINHIYEHRQTGNIWVYAGTPGTWGVYEYDGTNWIDHSSVPGLNSVNSVSPPYEDSKGTIWFSTPIGLQAYDGTKWTQYTSLNTSFKSNSIKQVFEDSRKNLWVMTDRDISVYDGKSWLSYDMPGEIGNANGYRNLMIEDDYGNIWVATRTGLLLFDGYKWTKFTVGNSPLPNNEIVSISRDRANNIWVGSKKGLTCIQFEKPSTSLPFSINGYTFLDTHADDLYDRMTETAVPNRKLLLLPDNVYGYSNALGYYQFHVTNPGTYTIKTIDDENLIGKKEITVTIDGGINTKADIPYRIGNIQDDTLAISTIGGISRCNNAVNYWLDIQNMGNADFNGKLTFNIDPVTTYNSSNLQPTEVIEQEVRWNTFTVPAFQNKQIRVVVNLPGFESMGDDIKFELTAAGDASGKKFKSQVNQKIVCSYDPNDKSVVPARDELLKTDELEYLIRFQNTGNDTAFTVVLRDTLSSLLDKGSVDIIAASHKYEATMDIKSGEMVFTFNNIQLPDDKANELASHGFIKYKVHLKYDAPLQSEIKNTAYIYFDRNPAIITNTTKQTLVEKIITALPVSQTSENSVVYPNPAKDFLYTMDKEGRIVLYNQLGKVVTESNADIPVNVSDLSSGMYILHYIKSDKTTIQKIEIAK